MVCCEQPLSGRKMFQTPSMLCTHPSSFPFHCRQLFHCVAGLYCPSSVSASLDCAHSLAAVNARGQLLCGRVAHFLVSPWEEPAGQMFALCLTFCDTQLFPPAATTQSVSSGAVRASLLSTSCLRITVPRWLDGLPCGFEVTTSWLNIFPGAQ